MLELLAFGCNRYLLQVDNLLNEAFVVILSRSEMLLVDSDFRQGYSWNMDMLLPTTAQLFTNKTL